jgi:pyruvate dehydrogenase E1 component alpha subunit
MRILEQPARLLQDSSADGDLGVLADPNALHGPIDLAASDDLPLDRMLERMMVIRAAEETIGDNVASGAIRCPCHLAIGQEAIAVGVAMHARTGDRVFGAHRSHGHYLALGGSLRGLMAEVLGKDTGVSRGMGGSMHLRDVEHGLFGTVPIVAATIPIAVGAALAAKLEGRGAVAVSFFGDGATEEGAFHESMNLASSMKLPILFVCENNLFSSHLHVSLRQPRLSMARYAQAHDIPWERVDGNDVVNLTRIAGAAVAAMRTSKRPQFIEAVTYRWRGHVGPREDDDVGVRRKDDLRFWKQRDPIRRLQEAMLAAGLTTPERIVGQWQAARAAVNDAWSQALGDPYPETRALIDRVYGGPEGA